MKLGTQDRNKAKWAIGLLAISGALGIYNFVPLSGLPTQETKGNTTTAKVQTTRDMRVPAFRVGLIEQGQFVPFNSSRNIFRMKEEIANGSPLGGGHNIETHNGGNPPSSVTTGPNIDLTFFGYARKSGEAKKVFVSQGDTIFIAQEGGLVALRYRILEIRNNSVLVQDVLNSQQQSLVLLQ